ncbi:putative tail fiber protein [Burkholderia phage BcepIL02]|uniref:Tail fiber protein n=1 Tax=Burkholderia phage BcepIL02 TaxID=2886898 RepID=C5IHQ1_9CAUD|nr:tail fiber protein [Burkholderia phage BcepIL02]ACR15052.1 putative tail fiber protein [Burkholderia phage BcepIL02]
MALKLANNAISKLAGAVAANATSLALTPGDGAKYPALGAGDWFPLTVVKSDGSYEVMRCTARNVDTLTVSRAQESTAALAFAAGDRVELRFTSLAAFNLPYLPSSGGTVAGPMILATPGANSSLEIGDPGFANTPFIDFHSAGTNNDYDVRMIASGGNATPGNGALDVLAFSTRFGGHIRIKKGFFLYALDGASERQLIGMSNDATPNVDIINSAAGKIRFINQAYNAELLTCDNNGNVWVLGNIVGFSDRRLKSNIKRIKGAMAKVRELVGVTFTRRRSKDKSRHMGFIAQDVEPIVPEVVRTDEKGMKSIAYPNLTALLAEALKELDERVTELEAKQ